MAVDMAVIEHSCIHLAEVIGPKLMQRRIGTGFAGFKWLAAGVLDGGAGLANGTNTAVFRQRATCPAR